MFQPASRNRRCARATPVGPTSRRPPTRRCWCALNEAAKTSSRGSRGSRRTVAGHAQAQQHGTSDGDAGIDDGAHLPRGQHIEQRGSGHERGAVEGVGIEVRERSAARADRDRSPVTIERNAVRRALDEVRVPVVQDPGLRAGQQRRQPSHHRARPASQVVDHDRTRCEPLGCCEGEFAGPGARILRFAKREPIAADLDDLAHPARRRSDPTASVAGRTSLQHRSGDRRGFVPRSRRGTRAHGLRLEHRTPRGFLPPLPQDRTQRHRIVRRGEDGGRAPCDRLRHSADACRHDRDAPGDRLGDDHAVALGARRRDDEIRGMVRVGESPTGEHPHQLDALREPGGSDRGGGPVREIGVGVQRADDRAAPSGQVGHARQRVDEHVLSLVGRDRADAEQVAPRCGSGRRRRGIRARTSDDDAIGLCERAGDEFGAGPFAGRDHAPGGVQRLALPFGRSRAVPDPGQGARDHVRQHDDPKTRRLRVEHLRRRDGEQSVDQHERVARERGHRPRDILPAAG